MAERYTNRAEAELGQYAESLTLARSRFLAGNFAEMALMSGSAFASGFIESVYMGKSCLISCADASISYKNSDRALTGTEQVIILQNLITASGRPLSGSLVSLRELPHGGANVFHAFKRRALDVLAEAFGKDPSALTEAGQKLGGEVIKQADAAVKISVLPRLPVIYAIWGSDEEFPAEASILFDPICIEYLPSVEDIAVAASFGVYEMADM